MVAPICGISGCRRQGARAVSLAACARAADLRVGGRRRAARLSEGACRLGAQCTQRQPGAPLPKAADKGGLLAVLLCACPTASRGRCRRLPARSAPAACLPGHWALPPRGRLLADTPPSLPRSTSTLLCSFGTRRTDTRTRNCSTTGVWRWTYSTRARSPLQGS